MQNFLNFFGHTIKTQNAFYLPAGDQRVSFIDARDILPDTDCARIDAGEPEIGEQVWFVLSVSVAVKF